MARLGIAYNLFDGEELLDASVRSVAPVAAVIVIVAQRVSNWGNAYEGGVAEAQRLLACGAVHEVVMYTPREGMSASEHETRKREIGLQRLRAHACTYFMQMDADECYDPQALSRSLRYMAANPTIMASACGLRSYYKHPQWTLGVDLYSVPFIHALLPETSMTAATSVAYRGRCDTTRTASTVGLGVHFFPESDVLMHHYTWVRDDIRRKLNNSSARGGIDADALLAEYEQAAPGQRMRHFKLHISDDGHPSFGINVGLPDHPLRTPVPCAFWAPEGESTPDTHDALAAAQAVSTCVRVRAPLQAVVDAIAGGLMWNSVLRDGLKDKTLCRNPPVLFVASPRQIAANHYVSGLDAVCDTLLALGTLVCFVCGPATPVPDQQPHNYAVLRHRLPHQCSPDVCRWGVFDLPLYPAPAMQIPSIPDTSICDHVVLPKTTLSKAQIDHTHCKVEQQIAHILIRGTPYPWEKISLMQQIKNL